MLSLNYVDFWFQNLGFEMALVRKTKLWQTSGFFCSEILVIGETVGAHCIMHTKKNMSSQRHLRLKRLGDRSTSRHPNPWTRVSGNQNWGSRVSGSGSLHQPGVGSALRLVTSGPGSGTDIHQPMWRGSCAGQVFAHNTSHRTRHRYDLSTSPSSSELTADISELTDDVQPVPHIWPPRGDRPNNRARQFVSTNAVIRSCQLWWRYMDPYW